MPNVSSPRALAVAAALSCIAAATAQAQTAAPAAKHPPVCAAGVRIFHDKAEVPVPHDTVAVPPSDGPVRVTSMEEAEAAEMAMRKRAGSVGATGVLVTDDVSEEGGERRMRRSLVGIYARADSARAQQACK